jgi:hypothetical protein
MKWSVNDADDGLSDFRKESQNTVSNKHKHSKTHIIIRSVKASSDREGWGLRFVTVLPRIRKFYRKYCRV